MTIIKQWDGATVKGLRLRKHRHSKKYCQWFEWDKGLLEAGGKFSIYLSLYRIKLKFLEINHFEVKGKYLYLCIWRHLVKLLNNNSRYLQLATRNRIISWKSNPVYYDRSCNALVRQWILRRHKSISDGMLGILLYFFSSRITDLRQESLDRCFGLRLS